MSLIAVLKELGGCGYTIGCGVTIVPIPAEISNYEEAEQWLYDHDYLYGTGRSELKSLMIYRVADEHSVDLKNLYETAKSRQEERKKLEIERQEKEMLLSLSAKFGFK